MIALIDERIDNSSLLALKNMGAELFLMPPAPYLQKGVASHPDMLVFCGFGKLFCHEKYYVDNKALVDSILSLSGLELVLSKEEISEKYPHDVKFNAALVGNALICNKKTVSKLILDAANDNDYKILDVPQGYTKCSTAIISDNAIITADKPIYSACISSGIDALLATPTGVELSGYDCGFIGGATGNFADAVYFCGDVSLHPDGKAINDFCEKHGKKVVCLSDKPLYDYGTIIFI